MVVGTLYNSGHCLEDIVGYCFRRRDSLHTTDASGVVALGWPCVHKEVTCTPDMITDSWANLPSVVRFSHSSSVVIGPHSLSSLLFTHRNMLLTTCLCVNLRN